MESQFELIPCPICDNSAEFVAVDGSRTDIYPKKFETPVATSKWTFCKCCSLLFQNPRPLPKVIQSYYDKNLYFGDRPDDIERLTRIAVRKHRHKVRFALEHCDDSVVKRGTAVDIGSGIGGCVKLLSDSGLKAMGIEPDPKIGEMGRQNLGVNVRTGFFAPGILENGSASFFYSNHVFEHVYDPNLIVKAMWDALQPGGYVFTVVPTYGWNSSWEAYAWQNLAHTFLFTHETLQELFEKHGFEYLQHKYDSGANEVWLLVRKPGLGEGKQSLKPKPFTAGKAVDYWAGVPLRSVAFLPLRAAHLFGLLWDSFVYDGIGPALRDLKAIVRTPIADAYRVMVSFLRQRLVVSQPQGRK